MKIVRPRRPIVVDPTGGVGVELRLAVKNHIAALHNRRQRIESLNRMYDEPISTGAEEVCAQIEDAERLWLQIKPQLEERGIDARAATERRGREIKRRRAKQRNDDVN